MSVWVIKNPIFFLMKTKLIWLAVLSANYWSNYFNVTRFQKKFFLDIFVLLIPLEIPSRYLNIIVGLDKAFNES